MSEVKTREVKVVLLGDTGVGKSSLVLRFVTNNFKPYNESTIGASFMSKVIISNGKHIKFQIWDTGNFIYNCSAFYIPIHKCTTFICYLTAGQEKYHSLARKYMVPFCMNPSDSSVASYVLQRSRRRHCRLRHHEARLLQDTQGVGGGAEDARS